MAISAGAAIIGGGLIGLEAVSATTLMYVGMAATVVGAITQNSTLAKIGGGLSLTGGIASLAANAGQTAANEIGTQSMASQGADASTSLTQSSAAGNAADVTLNAAPAQDMTGVSTTELAASPTASSVQAPAAAALNAPSTAAQELAGYFPSMAEEVGAGATGQSTATTATQAPNLAQSQAAGTQVPSANVAPAAPAAPSVNVSNGAAYQVAGNAANVTDAADNVYGQYMRDAAAALGKPEGLMAWFDGLTPTAKLAVGQMGAGLVSGVGKGAFDYSASKERNALTQQQIDLQRQQQLRQQANLSGQAPAIGMAFNPNVALYPQGVYAPPGIIQRARM